jgi:hypothetical protein
MDTGWRENWSGSALRDAHKELVKQWIWEEDRELVDLMDAGETDMSDSSQRAQWINRPASERHLSLAEWIEGGATHATAPPLAPSTPQRGRSKHSTGEMNGLEKRYAQHLNVRLAVGEILEWRFEPLKLRLAPATYWTPDFLVKKAGNLELHETKGHWEDDARVKIKWAAKDFGSLFRIIAVTEPKRNEWKFEEFRQE